MLSEKEGPSLKAEEAAPESLKGRIVLVTGARGGLGQVAVKRLLDAGAVVAAVHRDE